MLSLGNDINTLVTDNASNPESKVIAESFTIVNNNDSAKKLSDQGIPPLGGPILELGTDREIKETPRPETSIE